MNEVIGTGTENYVSADFKSVSQQQIANQGTLFLHKRNDYYYFGRSEYGWLVVETPELRNKYDIEAIKIYSTGKTSAYKEADNN